MIRYNDEYYSITHIDPGINRKSLFLYFSSYVESMRYKVEVSRLYQVKPLEDAELVHFRTLWCDVTVIRHHSATDADKMT